MLLSLAPALALIDRFLEESGKQMIRYQKYSPCLRRMLPKNIPKDHRYLLRKWYPLLKKEEYSHNHLKDFICRYFDNSFSSMVSFFVKESNLSVKDVDELLEIIKKGSEK